VAVTRAEGQDDGDHGYDYHGQDEARSQVQDGAGPAVLLRRGRRGAEDAEIGELAFQLGAGSGGQDAAGTLVEFLGGQAACFEVLGELGQGRVAVGVRDAEGAGGESAPAGSGFLVAGGWRAVMSSPLAREPLCSWVQSRGRRAAGVTLAVGCTGRVRAH
jgi:hypothetical protein